MNYTTTHCLFLTGQDVVSASLTFKFIPIISEKSSNSGDFFVFVCIFPQKAVILHDILSKRSWIHLYF